MAAASDATAVDLSLLEPVFAKYQGQRGVLIPVLQKAQETYGYLPRAVLDAIAERLDVSVGTVYGVATFYAQFYLEKRGRHVLKLCDGTACHVKGAPLLRATIEDNYNIRPGETTEDDQLTLEVVYCMGSCALAPVAVWDGTVTGRMRQETLLHTVKRGLT
jgi:NADH:ubiquinone oxidoreductase subunit E